MSLPDEPMDEKFGPTCWTKQFALVADEIHKIYPDASKLTEFHTTLVNDEGEHTTYVADPMDHKYDNYIQDIWDDFEEESGEFTSIKTLDLWHRNFPDPGLDSLNYQLERAHMFQQVRCQLSGHVDDSAYLLVSTKQGQHPQYMVYPAYDPALHESCKLMHAAKASQSGFDYYVVSVARLRRSATTGIMDYSFMSKPSNPADYE